MPGCAFNAADEAVGLEIDNTRLTINRPVPEPATIVLMGMGLAGLAGLRRKK